MTLACAALLCAAELFLYPVSAGKVPAEIVGETATLKVQVGRSHVLRTKADIRRTAVAAAGIVEISQFTPREIALAGRGAGKTTVTFWFSDPTQPPVSYAVEVVANKPAP